MESSLVKGSKIYSFHKTDRVFLNVFASFFLIRDGPLFFIGGGGGGGGGCLFHKKNCSQAVVG